ncbi:MAG: hypothetical protein KGN84_01240 [Acidobacteriota bacterium]|nr:hypothetical protein [Acidobacteriota bacterium]
MDLKAYYSKIRETEKLLEGEDIVVVSLQTSEGGKAGVVTEAPRSIAARLITEGRARLANDKEAADFHGKQREAKDRHDREEAARRLQVVMIPAHDGGKPKERS